MFAASSEGSKNSITDRVETKQRPAKSMCTGLECGRLSIEVDEDEIMPDRATHLLESKLALLEAFRFMHTFAS